MEPYAVPKRVLGRILQDRAATDGDATFLRFADRAFTYREVDRIANQLANGLASHGVRQGDKICVMMRNSPEFCFTIFGLARLGCVEVPINTAYKGELLQYVIDDSDSKIIIVDADMVGRVEAIVDELPKLQRVVVRGALDRPLDEVCGETPVTPYDELLVENAREPDVTVRHSDLMAIMYTSGTTGPSKGVMVSHSHAITFAYDWLKANAFTSDDRLYSPLPLFHTIAHTLGVVAVMLVGSEIALVERFSASRFWDDVRRYRATVAHGIFGIVPILLGQPESPGDRDHQLRSFYIGPSAASPDFERRFGAQVVEVYGATETGVVTCFPYGDARPGSCGRANEQTFEVKLFDDDDEEVAPGEIGEIVVRPHSAFAMMSGYYNIPAETADAWRNLWFHTGDFGRCDEEGCFSFVDRKKDAIRRRGENISSYEVERAVCSHPEVLEAAAIAVPADIGEDEVKVIVVPTPGAVLDAVALIWYLNDRLPYFMVPRYLEFLEELPKTTNGKVEKYRLRQAGERGITHRTWDREAHGIKLTR